MDNDEELPAEIPIEVRKALDAWDWKTNIPKLIKFALDLVKQKYWYGKRTGKDPKKRAEDFVMEVIEKVYSGGRTWDMQKCPDLYQFLSWAIRSEISNSCKSDENKSTKLSDFNEKDESRDEDDGDGVIKNEIKKFTTLVHQGNLSLDNGVTDQDENGVEEYLFGLMGFIEDDKDLKAMFDCIIEGAITPRAIAQKLNIKVEEVYNLKKRMHRRVFEYNNGLRATQKLTFKGGVKNAE